MKKIECQISDCKSIEIDEICEYEGYTRAEFARRALELYLQVCRHCKTNPDAKSVNLFSKV